MVCSHCTIGKREESPYNGYEIPAKYNNSSINSIVTYSPTDGYYGRDRLEVVAEDNDRAYTQIITVLFSVRYRLCLNGGICRVCYIYSMLNNV